MNNNGGRQHRSANHNLKIDTMQVCACNKIQMSEQQDLHKCVCSPVNLIIFETFNVAFKAGEKL